MANAKGMGLQTAPQAGATVASIGLTGPYNKIVVQADQNNAATEYVQVSLDGTLAAKLSPGGDFVIGDETSANVLDPSKVLIASTTGVGKYTGFIYQR